METITVTLTLKKRDSNAFFSIKILVASSPQFHFINRFEEKIKCNQNATSLTLPSMGIQAAVVSGIFYSLAKVQREKGESSHDLPNLSVQIEEIHCELDDPDLTICAEATALSIFYALSQDDLSETYKQNMMQEWSISNLSSL